MWSQRLNAVRDREVRPASWFSKKVKKLHAAHKSERKRSFIFRSEAHAQKRSGSPPLLKVVKARPSKTTTVGFIKSISSLISDARDTGCIFEKKGFTSIFSSLRWKNENWERYENIRKGKIRVPLPKRGWERGRHTGYHGDSFLFSSIFIGGRFSTSQRLGVCFLGMVVKSQSGLKFRDRPLFRLLLPKYFPTQSSFFASIRLRLAYFFQGDFYFFRCKFGSTKKTSIFDEEEWRNSVGITGLQGTRKMHRKLDRVRFREFGNALLWQDYLSSTVNEGNGNKNSTRGLLQHPDRRNSWRSISDERFPSFLFVRECNSGTWTMSRFHGAVGLKRWRIKSGYPGTVSRFTVAWPCHPKRFSFCVLNQERMNGGTNTRLWYSAVLPWARNVEFI